MNLGHVRRNKLTDQVKDYKIQRVKFCGNGKRLAISLAAVYDNIRRSKKKNSPRNESHKFLCTHIDTHEYRTPFENLKIFYSDTKTRKRIDRAEQIKTQKYLIYTPTNAHIFI